MIENSEFFCRPDFITPNPFEKELGVYQNLTFIEKATKMEIINLRLKVTSHNIFFFHEQNSKIGFILNPENIIRLETNYKGIIKKQLHKLIISMKNGNQVEVLGKGLEDAFLTMQNCLDKKEWIKSPTTSQIKSSESSKQESKIEYQTFQQRLKSDIQNIEQKQETLKTSFNSLDTLFKNAPELKEISSYLIQNMRNNNNNDQSLQSFINFIHLMKIDQTEEILQNIGFMEVITKDETGQNFYNEIAKQINMLCQEVFPKFGGIVSLLDVFYYYNKKRQTQLISPDELVQACQKFSSLGLPVKLKTYDNGIKVLESTAYDQEQDYHNFIEKYLTYDGLSAEVLAKKSGLSVIIARIKLENACKNGKIALADRIEGQKYYKNILIAM